MSSFSNIRVKCRGEERKRKQHRKVEASIISAETPSYLSRADGRGREGGRGGKGGRSRFDVPRIFFCSPSLKCRKRGGRGGGEKKKKRIMARLHPLIHPWPSRMRGGERRNSWAEASYTRLLLSTLLATKGGGEGGSI